MRGRLCRIDQGYFNPRSPYGERPKACRRSQSALQFQSTLPLRGATIHAVVVACIRQISIHAPLAGSDFSAHYRGFFQKKFQSTLPLRGATPDRVQLAHLVIISIHAPLAGSDMTRPRILISQSDFNPRSPCGERREFVVSNISSQQFQSTLPLRGATRWCDCRWPHSVISIHAPLAGSDKSGKAIIRYLRYFNPRSPCGERPFSFHLVQCLVDISIHAPLAGSDVTNGRITVLSQFQSTLPLRGATIRSHDINPILAISIHAPLAGSDETCCWKSFVPLNFNPRSPCGERRAGRFRARSPRCYFNPRSPCGERQLNDEAVYVAYQFQSTLPLRGATRTGTRTMWRRCYFNPRSPCGERPHHGNTTCATRKFQSTLPLRGATRICKTHIIDM